MDVSETTLLLERRHHSSPEKLSVLFAVICVVDVFGVFPIITLPKAIINCGFYGIILVTVVCLLQIYTATLLGKCWVFAADIYPTLGRKSRYPYSALAEVTFGKALSNFVNVLLDLTVFSGGIPNLIVASRNLQLLGLRISEGEVNISECYWILIVGVALCPVLWLGSPKDMKCICTVSVFMVFSVFLLLLGCLLFDSKPTNSPSEMLGSTDIPIWRSMLIAYGILAFQFDIHPTILTIQVDMKEKSKLPKAMFLGFMATLLMLGITTTVVVLMYGTDIQPSILETLPTTIPLHFAAALTTAQLYLTSVVSNNALYQHMEDCLCISREFSPKRCVLRTILTVLAVVLAESVPRFDIVMSFIGGALTGPLMFILPPLFYIKVMSLQRQHEEQLAMESFTSIVFTKENDQENLSRYREHKFKEDIVTSSISSTNEFFKCKCSLRIQKAFCVFVIGLGSLATVATTYVNFMNLPLSYSVLTKPCIYNISYTLLYI